MYVVRLVTNQHSALLLAPHSITCAAMASLTAMDEFIKSAYRSYDGLHMLL
jgi:hypothetical protein